MIWRKRIPPTAPGETNLEESQKLDRIKPMLPLRKMANNFELVSRSLKPKLMEQLRIDTTRPLTNYKLLIMLELTRIYFNFFGIHAANVVQLADRIEQKARLATA